MDHLFRDVVAIIPSSAHAAEAPTHHHLVEVSCGCRTWEISPLAPVGRCGLCGKRPT